MTSKKNENSTRNRVSMRIAAVFFVLAGLVVGTVFVIEATRERAAMNWPTADGTVVSSTYFVSGSGPRQKAEWEYSYSFVVDGKTYRGGSDVFGTGYSGPAKLNQNDKSAYEAYPAGTAITVYYDASDPNRSLFGPGPSWMNFALPLGGGLLLLGIGVITWRIAGGMAREAKTGAQ